MRSSTLPGSVLVASLALLVGACPASVEDVCHDDVCGVAIPPGCNPVDDIENQPSCVVSSFGIFVDAVRGSDASAGTKEAPVRTIGKALTVLGGRSRVYLCEGTYPEHVIVNGAVSLFGGFACDSWSFVGSRPRIAPEDEGAGIVFGPAASASTISDLEVTSKDALTPSASSIAVFVKGDVASLTLRRVSAIAGNAFPTAVSPGPPLSNVAGRTEGNPARGITGGPTKTCDCPLSGQSVGGRGGDGAAAAVTALDGARGAATPSSPTSGTNDGRAGLGAKSTGMACTAGGKGPNGSAGIGGTGARVLGTLTEDGWTPGVGTSGEYGRPGVGGGGGGGGNQSGGAGGGGGACGGCGGVGGAAGSGGGSSIAIAVGARSAIVLEQCTLVAGAGGPGISGGRGGAAVPGGTGATAATGACAGGDGGDGAGGSGGGGGAGGSSIGVLHAGAPPTIDASTTLRTAARGAAGGPGGVAGAAAGSGVVGATGGVGIAGVAEPTHALTVDP